MAQILFVNSTLNSISWYINTKTGAQSGSIVNGTIAKNLPSNALSFGWKTTSGFTGEVTWAVITQGVPRYAYVVWADQPLTTKDQRLAAMQAALGDDAGDGEEIPAVPAVSAVEWTNNSANDAQWVYYGTNGVPVSGPVVAGKSVSNRLPTAGPVYCAWKVSGFQGRMLRKINQTPPVGDLVQLTLDNQQ